VVKFPFLIDFFKITFPPILPFNPLSQMKIGLLNRDDDDKDKNNRPRNFIEWVNKELQLEIFIHKDLIQKLCAIVAWKLNEILTTNILRGSERLEDRLSLPENMWMVLRLLGNEVVGNLSEYIIYESHKGEKRIRDRKVVSALDLEKLYHYARFLGSEKVMVDPLMFFDVAKELLARVVGGQIEPTPRHVGDTDYNTIIHELVFMVMEAVLQHKYDHESAEQATDLFIDVIKSEQVTTGAKFIILNSFTNNQRGRGSQIHFDLNQAFDWMLKDSGKGQEIRDAVKYVFGEYDGRYLSGKDVVYEKEENFFYLFYQGWSGNTEEESEEICKIRAAAMRELEKYPQAVKLYWNSYSIDKERKWKSYEDVKESDVWRSTKKNSELYMKLSDLVEITEKLQLQNKDDEIRAKLDLWKKCVDDSQYIEDAKLQAETDNLPLKAVLIKREIIV